MSRSLNVDATLAEVMAMAARHGAAISAIEPLSPTGTRVVFVTGDAAATVALAFGRKVLTGSVTRTPWKQKSVS